MCCPSCGREAPGVGLVAGIVKVITYRCRCTRKWREKELVGSHTKHSMVEALEDLFRRYPSNRPAYIKEAILFLQYKIETDAPGEERKASSVRKADHWEKRLMKDLVGDDPFEE